MKNSRIYYLLLAYPSILFFIGCQPKEIPDFYINDPRAYIYSTPDSTRFSFSTKHRTVLQDTVWVRVALMGEASVTDRTINLEVDQQLSTAVKGVDFDLPDLVIPASVFVRDIPVVLFRTPEMQSKELVIALYMAASKDFETGIPEKLRYRIMVNDMLSKPGNWDSFISGKLFGPFSLEKYKFIIDVLGIAEFPDDLDTNTIFYYRQKVKKAYLDYVTENGELIDENNQAVTFP